MVGDYNGSCIPRRPIILHVHPIATDLAPEHSRPEAIAPQLMKHHYIAAAFWVPDELKIFHQDYV